VVDRAAVLDLVEDQLVLVVEEQHPELLARLVGQGDLHIGQQGAPGADHRALADRLAPDPQRDLAQQPQVQRRLLADARHGAKVLDRGGGDRAQRSEPRQQRLGDRLDVAAREGAEQEQLEQLIVRHRVQTLQCPLAQALAMAKLVWVIRHDIPASSGGRHDDLLARVAQCGRGQFKVSQGTS
jgi:hypothetical protein